MIKSKEQIEEIISALKELSKGGDAEFNHKCADDILCKLLIDLGYEDVIDAYNEIDKWYA